MKKGTKAVELYLAALIKGKTKIPRCNLVILGEERVGKTSLYRLLVLKGFDPCQDSTRGIDNTVVETLDRRNVMAEDWSEKDDQMVEDHADQQFVRGVVGALPSHLLTQSESRTKIVTESELYEEISKLELSLAPMTSSASAAQGQPTKRSNLQRMHSLLQDTTAEPPLVSPHHPPSQPEDKQPQLKDIAVSSDQDPSPHLLPSQPEDEQPQLKDVAVSSDQDPSPHLLPSPPEDEQPQLKDVAESSDQDPSPHHPPSQPEDEQPRLKDVAESSDQDPSPHLLPSPPEDEQPQLKDVAESSDQDPSPHHPPSPPEDEQPQLKDVAESNDQDPTASLPAHRSNFSKFKEQLLKFLNMFRKKRSRHSQENRETPSQPKQQTIPESQILTTNGDSSHSSVSSLPTQSTAKVIGESSHSSVSSLPTQSTAKVIGDSSHSSVSSLPTQSTAKVIVSNKQAMMINKEFMAAASNEKVDPVLLLNALDFAGQKEYRPMHHCFLTRRAMYLVVFNLQHVIQYLEQKESSDAMTVNPFEEIRYWLHSIHIHTLPAVPGKEKRPLKNVCLVGTHRAPPDPSKGRRIKDEELLKINDLIMEDIQDDDRCLNHLHFMGPDHKRIFIAVENSIDGKEDEHRKASGAKALQEEVKEVTDHLPFIEEDYPVSWLNLETKLVQWRKKLEGEKSSLLIQVDKVLRLAAQCGIHGREGQLLALEFFHETGKIVYLSK